jgi:hypothetical protein
MHTGNPLSTEAIILLLVVSMAALIGAAFVMQTIERNRKERIRAESQLRRRRENLVYMLDHFPPHFLSTDLKGLVCKSIIDVYEQLLKIAPRNKEYQEGLQAIARRWDDIRSGKGPSYQPLDNPGQVRDTKALLGLLNNFITRLFETGAITKLQAADYSRQLKQLYSQTTIDQYAIAARKAENEQKYRLAIHYYQSAVDKIRKSSLDAAMHEHSEAYRRRIEELTALLPAVTDTDSLSELEAAERDKEWSAFVGQDDDDWKKRKIYD